MNDFLDEAVASAYTPARTARPPHSPSTMWTPGVDTERGEIVAGSFDTPQAQVDWAWLIEDYGLDPAVFAVEDDRVEVRAWDVNVGNQEIRRLYYYKARLVRRRTRPGDLDALVADIKRFRPLKRTPPAGEHTLVACLADWQLGKRDQDGTRGVADRVLDMIGKVDNHVATLRRGGVDVGRVVVAGMGDLVEGCQGFYPSQAFNVELDGREQATVARRLLVKVIQAWSVLAPHLTVVAVAGNHGEKRVGGKWTTTPGDNLDLEVFDQVADVLTHNPDRFGHVEFIIPKDEMAVTVEIAGRVVGFTHGHVGGRPSKFPASTTWEYWRGQAHGWRPVGDADLLVTGHWHHLTVLQNGPRTLLQCPPLDSGSDWYAEKYGYESTPGTLTFTVGPDGWDNLRIL